MEAESSLVNGAWGGKGAFCIKPICGNGHNVMI